MNGLNWEKPVMQGQSKEKRINYIYFIAFVMLIVSNVCFYTLNTMNIFLISSGIAMFLVIGMRYLTNPIKIRIDGFMVWTTILFSMYTIYGCLFLRAGDYNWDYMVFLYIECICMYLILRNFISNNVNALKYISLGCDISIILISVYILQCYRSDILTIARIGDSLSGNVNVVGLCLGILSLISSNSFKIYNRKIDFICVIIAALFMLLTGSKKAVLILIIDILVIATRSRSLFKNVISIGVLLIVLCFFLFKSEHFYNIIGFRIIDMLGTMGFGIQNAAYSHSTGVRELMIKEGFQIFLKSPIWGGGMNYFYLNTTSGYPYSHCNFTEILCNFGIIGLFLYYLPYAKFIKLAVKIKQQIDFKILCLSLIMCVLVVDWAAVSFSCNLLLYIPVILLYAYYTEIKRIKYSTYRTKNSMLVKEKLYE